MGKYCPPCIKCAFKGSPQAVSGKSVEVIMPRTTYGCASEDPGTPVVMDGMVGMLRSDGFHPRTEEGAVWHKEIGAPF